MLTQADSDRRAAVFVCPAFERGRPQKQQLIAK